MKHFIYGTLRRGHYNYRRLNLEDNARYCGDAVLHGAQMFNLGDYPCIVLTDNDEDEVVGELYYIFDPPTLRTIHQMETLSGYTLELVFIEDKPCLTYVKPPLLIQSGDWTKEAETS